MQKLQTGTIRLLIKLEHLALQICAYLLLYLSMLFLATAKEREEQIVIVDMQIWSQQGIQHSSPMDQAGS